MGFLEPLSRSPRFWNRLSFCFTVILILSPMTLAASDTPKQEQEKVSVCISCHRELGGKMAEPVALWEKSFHHKMGNNCEGCHGGDPTDEATAMSPEKGFVGAPKPGEVAAFCGKCHVGVKENYMKSPHHAAALQGLGPNCISCHHSHDVQEASFELINENLCSTCHSYENPQKIKKSFVTAEMELQTSKARLGYLEHRGMPVKRLEEKLFALRNSLHQMTHTLDLGEIQNKTQGVLKELGEMNAEMDVFQKKIHRRWWIGGAVIVFLSALIFVLIKLLKTYEAEE